MTDPSSNAAAKKDQRQWLSIAVALVLMAVLLFFSLFKGIFIRDPYVRTAVSLKGSEEKGSRLFRMNCAGCHGLEAQGLLGPNLQQVTNRRTDAELVKQVISGRTPPMPRFQLEEQEMADLLAYLHNLE